MPSRSTPMNHAPVRNSSGRKTWKPANGDDRMSAPNRTLKQKAYHGMKEYLVISFYLWVVFGLLVVYKAIILAQHHIAFAPHGLALINALALAKVMLVAREVHFADYFEEAPLIIPTLIKSAAFAVVLGCFKILEATVVGLYRGQSFGESITDVGGGTLEGILALTALLAVLLI